MNDVLNVHLLQRKIDKKILKLEKSKAKVTLYKEKIEKKIENIQEDKVFFRFQVNTRVILTTNMQNMKMHILYKQVVKPHVAFFANANKYIT